MSGVVQKDHRALPPPLDVQGAAREMERLERENPPLAALAERRPGACALLKGVFGASPWLTRVIHAEPDFARACFEEDPARLFEGLLEAVREAGRAGRREGDEAALMRALRLSKRRVALLLALGDISGLWELEEVTARLSAFADAAVRAAHAFAIAEAHRRGKLTTPQPEASGQVIIAMGKHGARELNYSSDIDLVVFHDEEKAPLAAGVEAAPLFVRITRQVMRILSEVTGEGYVFRTDLRLRPDPGSTQVSVSLAAAEIYYQTLGQNWERAAMIKARPVSGDLRAGEEFLRFLSPWIWRRHLDFAAIADIASLKRQIHAVKGHGEVAVRGHDLKLGRGGIREIEFFVQTQQLVAGGRNPALRGRRTLEVLDALADAGWVKPSVAAQMKDAYRFLRTLEHRVQMQMDAQTHAMPRDDEALERLARFAGFADADALAQRLRATLETVQHHYNALFEDAPELGAEEGALVFTGAEDDPETMQTLSRMGFSRPRDAAAIIRDWHHGRYRALRAPSARQRLTEIVPALLRAISRAGEADAGLLAFDRFLQGLPAGLQLFSLLRANPHLLDLLVSILVTAPQLAAALARRPRLFDAVLAPDFFAPLPDRAAQAAALEAAVPEDLAHEEALDAARIFASEQKFRIGVRLVTETITPQEASAAYTALAEAIVARMLRLARRQMEQAHGTVAGARVAVIAMGKLGGAEMTATSDLDLIVVHDFEPEATASSGPRPLSPGQYFARLAQRLVSALSAPTAEGVLYEVDMRLRPSGSQGPVATHIESFRRYHEERAWTWEYLALTRARVIAGDAALRGQIEEIIHHTLTRPRDVRQTLADVLDMRRRILREKPPHSPWDVKLAAGGLVDVEFIVQALQLLVAPENPSVLAQNTARAIRRLHAAGALDAADSQALEEAHALYGHLMHILRLCMKEGFSGGDDAPQGLARLLANAARTPDMAAADARLREAQERIRTIFIRLIGPLDTWTLPETS